MSQKEYKCCSLTFLPTATKGAGRPQPWPAGRPAQARGCDVGPSPVGGVSAWREHPNKSTTPGQQERGGNTGNSGNRVCKPFPCLVFQGLPLFPLSELQVGTVGTLPARLLALRKLAKTVPTRRFRHGLDAHAVIYAMPNRATRAAMRTNEPSKGVSHEHKCKRFQSRPIAVLPRHGGRQGHQPQGTAALLRVAQELRARGGKAQAAKGRADHVARYPGQL